MVVSGIAIGANSDGLSVCKSIRKPGCTRIPWSTGQLPASVDRWRPYLPVCLPRCMGKTSLSYLETCLGAARMSPFPLRSPPWVLSACLF